jgi:hypothetical protein
MMLEMMKELFGIAHIRDDEEEVPNVKRMRIVEGEVSLSQPVTVAVLPEEEEVSVLQGPSVAPKEEEFPAPAVTVSQGPPVAVPLEEEEVLAALLVPVSALVISSSFFFSSKTHEILLALLITKCSHFNY